jgi:lipopolysaccharide transport system ATP-binding protein
MSTIAIKVENLGKLYRIGEIGTGTLSHDLNRWWASFRGKEDPFSKVGETNDRTIPGGSDYVWALKNINFDVEQGEILGIIGANGAGKSTLLKILSKVTNPTHGHIKIKGRIASLLEVGTGFHPELTGRENIFLNGAILGMTKREIKTKFDEIVDFAGVERYIDTPVKRYSSGMYVRLAFAVAAFLEPEILIIDEVLAVGDVEFQKKCLGRIKDVSANDGRTVLFVSHDLAAMSVLTQRAVLLNKGEMEFIGGTQIAINKYLLSNHNKEFTFVREPNFITPTITKVMVKTSEPNNVHAIGKPLYIHCDVHIPKDCVGTSISIQIFNIKGNSVVYAWLFDNETIQICRTAGVHKLVCELPNCNLYKGSYYIRVNLANNKTREYFEGVDNVCHFNVEMLNYEIIDWAWQDDICAYLEKFNWYNNDTKIIQG